MLLINYLSELSAPWFNPTSSTSLITSVADPGYGFGDLSLVNNFHLTSIIFSVVSKVKKVWKPVHNSVLIYIRTPQLTGHSCMCVYAKTEN